MAGTAQVYDANGNLTSDGTYTFTYDEENRLRTASGAGYTSTYEYDPLGRRRAKVVNGVTTRYASDGAEEIEERDGSQVVLRKYVYGAGIDDRIAMLDATCAGGGRCFYLTNWQGSATTLINQDGTPNAVYHYGPYGEGTNWTPSDAFTGNPFRYTGRRVDPETGLYYYRARYYSPRTGRFLQTDPVGTKDDLNLYTYVGNDPLDKFDPDGERPVDVYIWQASGTSVGHVMVTEHASRQVILSQFPANGLPYGRNVLRNFEDTMHAEGRLPDRIWTFNIQNDKAFDAAAAKERGLKWWSASPTCDSTQCSIAADRALIAGGAKLSAITSGTLMPGFFDNNIAKNQAANGGNVTQTLSSAAASKGYQSITINPNGTITGSFTITGSRIPRSTTCDATGNCTTN